MEQFKIAKILMLATNETKGDFSKERIYPCLLKYSWMFDKNETGKLIYSDSNIRTPTQLQHLYIISNDEKPNKGDYYIIDNIPEVLQNNDLVFIDDNCRKVIATTDKSLIIESEYESIDFGKQCNYFLLPQPSQQFIEKYIEEYNKGNVITDVLVEYESDFNSCFCTKDICNGNNCPKKLKVNPKDNTITIKKLKEVYTKEELCQILENLTFFIWKEVGIHYPVSLGNDAKDKFINNEL